MINVNLRDYNNYLRDQEFLIVTPDSHDCNLFKVLNALTLGEYEVWRCFQGRLLNDVVWICKCPHHRERLKRKNEACKHIIAVLNFIQARDRKEKHERRCVTA